MDPHRTTGVHSFADDSTWFPEAQTSLELLGEGDEVQQRDRVLFHLGGKGVYKNMASTTYTDLLEIIS